MHFLIDQNFRFTNTTPIITIIFSYPKSFAKKKHFSVVRKYTKIKVIIYERIVSLCANSRYEYSSEDERIFENYVDTHVFIKSMACAFSCSALCKSASINMSAAFSTANTEHRTSSHIILSLPKSY